MAALDTREMIARLVGSPSVSSTDPRLDMGNLGVTNLLAEWLEHEGWAVECQSVSDGKRNLIATLGRGEGGLVLAGHTDTVPFDESGWSSDPFELSERDDRLFGLGTCDMKSFLAMAVEAARAFDANALRAPLILLATADEETGMAGARALVRAGRPRGRYAVIGEPTSLRPVRTHKGCSMSRLELVGRSGHSSDPALGASALDGMHVAMSAIMRFREELAAAHRHPALSPPHPTLNLGRVEGGDNPNRICGRCTLDYDLRVLPGMDAATALERLRAEIAAAVEGRGLQIGHHSLCEEVPPFETPPDSAIVAAVESLTGAPAGGVSFGTEAPFLTALGTDTVVLGPGDIAVAHQPDEHLRLDRIRPMVGILEQLIGRFCMEAA